MSTDADGHLFFNPRGLRAWHLAEKHRLALEGQAEEHHRDCRPGLSKRQGHRTFELHACFMHDCGGITLTKEDRPSISQLLDDLLRGATAPADITPG